MSLKTLVTVLSEKFYFSFAQKIHSKNNLVVRDFTYYLKFYFK